MTKLQQLRIRLGALIAGATPYTFQGRDRNGNWIKGTILATPEGFAALKAPFRTRAKVYSDTALTSFPPP